LAGLNNLPATVSCVGGRFVCSLSREQLSLVVAALHMIPNDAFIGRSESQTIFGFEVEEAGALSGVFEEALHR
jgi:hypothetical protein